MCALKSIKHRAAGVDLLLLLPLLYFYELLGNAELADLQQSYLNPAPSTGFQVLLGSALGKGPTRGVETLDLLQFWSLLINMFLQGRNVSKQDCKRSVIL